MFSHLQRHVCAVALLKTTNSCRRTLPSIIFGDKSSPLQIDGETTLDLLCCCERAFYIVSGEENCKAEVELSDFLRSLQT